MWSERWHSPEEWLGSIEQSLKQTGYGCVIRGGAFDRWDLELRGGGLGAIRVRVAIEEHGTGRQLLRLRSWPRWSFLGIVIMILLAELGVAAMLAERWVAGVFLIAAAGLLAGRALQESAAATSAALCAVDRRRQQGEVQLSPRSVEERA